LLFSGIPCLMRVLIVWSPDSLQVLVSDSVLRISGLTFLWISLSLFV